MGNERAHDLVVYGATGFVGKLTAAYLAAEANGARIALAGRSRSKLESVRDDLGAAAADWSTIVADASDVASLEAMSASTAVIATTVGPFRSYGMPLAAACAKTGTHYADLTGEVVFVRDLIDQTDAAAKASGARIVVSCGFDSIPSDLGVLALATAVREDGGELGDTKLVVTALKGGVSGGTVASLKAQVDEMKGDPAIRRLVADPYGLSPHRDLEPSLGDERDVRSIRRDEDLGRWLAPFAMGQYNTRIVRRSNALQDWAYGRSFTYNEYMGFAENALGLGAAVGVTAGLGVLAGGLAFGPTRAVLDRVLPDPGDGPSEKVQRAGFFTLEIHTTTPGGKKYVASVTGKKDPGYAGTAVMLGEAALALAQDQASLPPSSGVLTPATGIGQPLIDRLRGHGFTFDVNPVAG